MRKNARIPLSRISLLPPFQGSLMKKLKHKRRERKRGVKRLDKTRRGEKTTFQRVNVYLFDIRGSRGSGSVYCKNDSCEPATRGCVYTGDFCVRRNEFPQRAAFKASSVR